MKSIFWSSLHQLLYYYTPMHTDGFPLWFRQPLRTSCAKILVFTIEMSQGLIPLQTRKLGGTLSRRCISQGSRRGAATIKRGGVIRWCWSRRSSREVEKWQGRKVSNRYLQLRGTTIVYWDQHVLVVDCHFHLKRMWCRWTGAIIVEAFLWRVAW